MVLEKARREDALRRVETAGAFVAEPVGFGPFAVLRRLCGWFAMHLNGKLKGAAVVARAMR